MTKKKLDRPEHVPKDHEWLPDAYKRDVEPLGPEARELVRQALAEGEITALLRTPFGERHPIPPRMWEKEPVAEKVYPRFEDGWMKTALEPTVSPKPMGWIFVRKGAIAKILQSTAPAGTAGAEARCRTWLESLPVKPIPGKGDLSVQAQKKFHGLSRRGFDRAWATAAPDGWKRPGRKS